MKVNRERQTIWANTCHSLDLDYKTLEELQKEVKVLIKEYGPAARFSMQYEPYSNSEKQYPYLQEQRLENDAEYAQRIANEEKWAEQAAARDRAEYERLQKIFGKSSP